MNTSTAPFTPPATPMTNMPSPSLPNRPSERPFRFMDLPAELRLQVYIYALVVGKIFYTPTAFERKECIRFPSSLALYATPTTSLLRVCRQIHAEAEPVYLSKNLFFLPHGYLLYSPFRTVLVEAQKVLKGDMSLEKEYPDRPLFSRRGLDLVRNLSIALCARGSDLKNHFGMTRSAWDSTPQGLSFNRLTQPQRMSLAHKNGNTRLGMQWTFQVRAVTLFIRGLDYIEIDLNNSFCATGCCRMVYARMDIFELLKPKDVRVVGTLGRQEEKWILQTWARKMNVVEETLTDTYGVRFAGKDVWGKWAVEDEDEMSKKDAKNDIGAGVPDLMVG